MSQTTRLDLERQALGQFFPQFKIQNPHSEHGGVLGKLVSNGGYPYVIWLSVRNYPNVAPSLYVIEPNPLLDSSGRPLRTLGSNHAMHLLEPDHNGHPQICHYNGKFWHPKISLYKILMKARLWIEAYECHLSSGKPIDTYLSHM